MPISSRPKRTYLKIKEGQFVTGKSDSETILGSVLNARLRDIQLYETEINKMPVKQWNIVFHDGQEEYVWSTFFDGFIFQHFLNCMLSVENFNKPIEISAYKNKKQQTAIFISQGGDKIEWKYSVEELPKIEPLLTKNGTEAKDASGRIIYDKEARMKWTIEKVAELKEKLKSSTAITATKEDFDGDDIPEPDGDDEVPF
jgi:hypothetical protein